MSATYSAALKTSEALVPPKPKELESTARMNQPIFVTASPKFDVREPEQGTSVPRFVGEYRIKERTSLTIVTSLQQFTRLKDRPVNRRNSLVRG